MLPLAYRAKRLVIVGDPQQLPPVVTANPQAQRTLAAQAGTTHEELATANLTYGEDSAYTAFAARHGRDPYLLEEHYRCHPEIIQFCNEHFYSNRLTVLTGVDATDDRPRGLKWHEVDGRTERGRSGGALNRAEADAVTAWIAECGLPPTSLGVVTPFRAQARLIRQLLSERAGPAFKDVRVGTAHTFQGGECETVLFSTVLSVDANPGTVAWLEGERNLGGQPVHIAAALRGGGSPPYGLSISQLVGDDFRPLSGPHPGGPGYGNLVSRLPLERVEHLRSLPGRRR